MTINTHKVGFYAVLWGPTQPRKEIHLITTHAEMALDYGTSIIIGITEFMKF